MKVLVIDVGNLEFRNDSLHGNSRSQRQMRGVGFGYLPRPMPQASVTWPKKANRQNPLGRRYSFYQLILQCTGLAKAGWNLDQRRARANDSLEKHGGVDTPAFEKLSSLLRYVDGDYQAPRHFQALRKELRDAQYPAHYLAIPLLCSKPSWNS